MRRIREHKTRAALAGVIALLAAGAIVAAAGTGTRHPTKTATVSGGFSAAAKVDGSAGVNASQSVGADSLASTSAGATGAAAPTAAGGVGASTPSPASTPNLTAAGGPKVVKTATLRVQVGRGHFDDAFAEASSVAGRYQGYVSDSSSQTHDKQAAEGSLTIRVPADKFDAARADLTRLGKVDHVDISGQDVTSQLVDFAARIHSLQAQEDALQTLLSRARSVGEVLDVQGQLFNVRQQIEQLQAQQANLDGEASFATITVSLFEPGAAVTPPKPVPATGLAHSWHLAVHGSAAVIGGTLVVIGYLLPALLLVLLALPVLRLVRRTREAPAVTPAS
jgi:hypothetical protein